MRAPNLQPMQSRSNQGGMQSTSECEIRDAEPLPPSLRRAFSSPKELGCNADADDHNIRLDLLSPLQNDPFAFNPSDVSAEVKAHPLSGMSFQDQIGQFSPKHFLERMLLRRDDVDGKATAG
jgi:hypothetical protein